MAKENVQKDEERLEQIETTLGKTEMFIEKHQKSIMIVIAAIIVVILAVFGFKKFVVEPREAAAQTAIFRAEQLFENDDYATALNGDGNNAGFLDVINEYGSTKTGNLARYYAGICYLNTGDFNNAIKYLGEYKGKDQIVRPLAIGAMGDAYMELDNAAEAAKCYERAANETANSFTGPMFLMRAGLAYEMVENYKKALDMYKTIKAEYPNSNEGFNIDKYIAYVEAKMAE
ncbi:MAG: tetratricopeptide repeat protein [Bacteroidales bacterium]|jgi:tetratricopeptide (TPR) repeat protein|nr:tetratricopeptide repeat protein [Bacteroidales bacterium]MBO7528733.1 tetratricopeptide repeat protein [Bacteroidales bacterium]MBQ3843536.1 tetratricopeptide repeat protein [Bacteroidales bacterium]